MPRIAPEPASSVLRFGRIAALLRDHALLAPLLNETVLVRDDALAVCPAPLLISTALLYGHAALSY